MSKDFAPVSLDQDILEFRTTKAQLNREIGIIQTKRQIVRIFEIVTELEHARWSLGSPMFMRADDNTIIDVTKFYEDRTKREGYAHQNEVQLRVIRGSGRASRVLHELSLVQNFETSDWELRYRNQDTHNQVGANWKRPKSGNLSFNAEETFDQLPEINEVENALTGALNLYNIYKSSKQK